MKINTKDLYYPASIAFKLTVSDKESWNAGDRKKAAKSNLKARGLKKQLPQDTFKEILELNGWECVEEPREGMFRKKEMRNWKVYEDGSYLQTVKSETKEEAINTAAQNKYNDLKTTDHKGRTKFLWELSVCDMIAEEV